MSKKQNKIAIIVVYFGEWPTWISYFIHSLSKNPLIDFIIFSNTSPLSNKYTNIAFHKQTLIGLCSLIHRKLGIKTKLQNPYKLCDFKPTFGILFEDFLSSYDYWGYCDVDLLFNSKMQEVVLHKLERYDILMGYKDFASGPFALFRNSKEINLIFTKIDDYEMILSSPSWYGFDEHIIKSENVGFSIKKIFHFLIFLMKKPGYILNYRLLKFHFQWYYKRVTVTEPVDLSEALYLYKDNGTFNVGFCPMVTNDTDYVRNGRYNWEIFYRNGSLFDLKNQELIIFHFASIKKRKEFLCELKEIAEEYNVSINNAGIRLVDE